MDKYKNLTPTPERDAMNAFPFWWDKIKDADTGILKLPKTVVIPVPPEIQRAFYCEDPGDMDAIGRFVEDAVKPAMRDAGIGLCFIKNGCYSHKFDASRACLPILSDLPHAVLTVMNEAMLRCGFQYDGTECLVVRERVTHDPRKTPCIYNGLPFRTEFRVFYDFDTESVIFATDYWDRGYVRKNLHDRTDQIIYDNWHPEVHRLYKAYVHTVQDAVADAMKNVQGLSGPWSVDVMLDEDDNFWLIDMAVAEISAYWEKRPGRALEQPEPWPDEKPADAGGAPETVRLVQPGDRPAT